MEKGVVSPELVRALAELHQRVGCNHHQCLSFSIIAYRYLGLDFGAFPDGSPTRHHTTSLVMRPGDRKTAEWNYFSVEYPRHVEECDCPADFEIKISTLDNGCIEMTLTR